MTLIEGMVVLAVIAFIVLVIFMIQFISSATKTAKQLTSTLSETQQTIHTLTQDIQILAKQTEDILSKSNALLADVQHKSETIDPVFSTVSELSESISDLNQTGREFASQMASIGKFSLISKAGIETLKTLKRRNKVPDLDPDLEPGSG